MSVARRSTTRDVTQPRGRRRRGDAARGHHARAGPRLRRLRRSRRSPSCTSCCRRSPAARRRRRHDLERRRPVVAGARAASSSACPSAATWSSSGPSSSAGDTPIGWRESYEITMAGLAATRLFAAAGAGGIALTAWALRRSGMERADGGLPDGRVPRRCSTSSTWARSSSSGSACASGSSTGPAPFAITVVPAVFALVLIGIFLAMSLLPRRRRAAHHAVARGHGARRAHHGQGS